MNRKQTANPQAIDTASWITLRWTPGRPGSWASVVAGFITGLRVISCSPLLTALARVSRLSSGGSRIHSADRWVRELPTARRAVGTSRVGKAAGCL
jgi:hypothetical protein